MAKGILARLAEGPVLGDGGYLLELEKRGYVQAGPFTPEVAIEHQPLQQQRHQGSDAGRGDCLEELPGSRAHHQVDARDDQENEEPDTAGPAEEPQQQSR